MRGRASTITFTNATELDSARLEAMCLDALAGWHMGRVDVRVRYSRSTDFSGTCFYGGGRIFVNLGRHLSYPYRLGAFLARAVTRGDRWWRPRVTIELADGYQVVLFVFLHECYHWLIKRARRNRRQKESMCDRFAARVLVDGYGAAVRDAQGRPFPRDEWDFQDLDGFVGAARAPALIAPTSPQPAVAARAALIAPTSPQPNLAARAALIGASQTDDSQLLLFTV